jgi:hypothetical protein
MGSYKLNPKHSQDLEEIGINLSDCQSRQSQTLSVTSHQYRTINDVKFSNKVDRIKSNPKISIFGGGTVEKGSVISTSYLFQN